MISALNRANFRDQCPSVPPPQLQLQLDRPTRTIHNRIRSTDSAAVCALNPPHTFTSHFAEPFADSAFCIAFHLAQGLASPEFKANPRKIPISICSATELSRLCQAHSHQDKRSIFHSILQFPKECKKEEEEKSLNPFGESKE
jgi:hypothetical protein